MASFMDMEVERTVLFYYQNYEELVYVTGSPRFVQDMIDSEEDGDEIVYIGDVS